MKRKLSFLSGHSKMKLYVCYKKNALDSGHSVYPPKLPFTSYARREVHERRIGESLNNPLQVLHLNA